MLLKEDPHFDLKEVTYIHSLHWHRQLRCRLITSETRCCALSHLTLLEYSSPLFYNPRGHSTMQTMQVITKTVMITNHQQLYGMMSNIFDGFQNVYIAFARTKENCDKSSVFAFVS